MTSTAGSDPQGSSTRPYLIRALHDWCTDNGFTPYIAVFVDASVQVPMEYVKNNEIVLNVGFEATNGLRLGNEAIEFKARFGGTARDIIVPVDHVVAIYARENGQGMAFPAPAEVTAATEGGEGSSGERATGDSRPVPLRSLRLAASESTEESAAASSPSGSPAEEPPEPPAGGTRPSLKRVK